jgi:undecaprenyl-diphosphatase
MLEQILKIDTQIFLWLNKLGHPHLDEFMIFTSENIYCLLLVFGILCLMGLITFKKKFIPIFFIVLVSFGLSDLASNVLFKKQFERLRPCWEQSLATEITLTRIGCSGKYGFVSSHAANTFSMILIFVIFFRTKWPKSWLLFIYPIFISYTRIYLGKHYPLDLIGGGGLGLLVAYMTFKVATYKNILKLPLINADN